MIRPARRAAVAAGAVVAAVVAAGCGGAQVAAPSLQASRAPLSVAADERMILVPAGRFIAGSTPEERATACDDFQTTTGADTARTEHWFEREADRHVVALPAFHIDLMPVTQAEFAEFVAAERVAPPAIDEAGWQAQGVALDFASHAVHFAWRGSEPPSGREDHPVVLVPWPDAERYCTWRGALRGERRRLPTADEFEKAGRGDGGLPYPWGSAFEASKLNSAVHGPSDTTPVGTYPAGASPYGALDMAGNVYQWTATRGREDGMVVKGSAWRDFAGLGRGAWLAEHPRGARNLAVGFRCAGDAP